MYVKVEMESLNFIHFNRVHLFAWRYSYWRRRDQHIGRVVVKCPKYQNFNFIEIVPTRGLQKYVENLHQKLETVLQIKENTLRNRVPDSRVLSVYSSLNSKILEVYKLALGNRALAVPNAFKIREK